MNTKLPSALEIKLADFRRRVWMVKLIEGLLAAVFGLAISYLLVFVLDRLIETPVALRGILLIAGAATLGLGLPLKWHRWVWKQRRLEDAARLLRHKHPRLGDQLLGIVELARLEHPAAGRSERLVEAAMAQAAEAVKDKDFTNAVPAARHRQWAWTAAGAVAVIAAIFIAVSDAARNAALRWLMPWKNVDRYTFARIEPLPDRIVVPYAEAVTIPVTLSPDTKREPTTSIARVENQPAIVANLQEGTYHFTFPPQKEDRRVFLSVGDIRKKLLLQPRMRPELTGLAVRLRLPEYLGYKSEPRIELRGSTVSILRGSHAAFEANASRLLQEATVDGSPVNVDGNKVLTSYAPVTEDTIRVLTWQDQDGLTPREPLTLKIQAVEDEAPKVLARRDSLEQVILDTEVVTFDLSVSDDFGIKRVGLEWVGSEMGDDGKASLHGEKVAAAGENEKRELTIGATFSAAREGVPPQALEIRAWAEDYLPGRKRSYSASFVLHVLNKTDHAIWLTQQFGRWLEVAKESYEREQQLHQINKELRALTPEELDRPENRRKISQQAAAENANAARLEALNSAGRRLVEQATKNEEFDADRLESWATMLQSLRDIAANRMPSVSELLKQSASAAAAQLANSSATRGTPEAISAKPETASNQSSPKGSQESGASLRQGESSPNGAQIAANSETTANPSMPSIQDNEKGYLEPSKTQEARERQQQLGSGKLSLPTTTIAAAPNQKDNDAGPPQSPAQERMDSAIAEQRDLLVEFAKVSDQLGEILASLEASTFVKRLKAASREQMKLASNISEKMLDSFGIELEAPAEAKPIALKAKDQSEVVRVIQSDLAAYFQRKQDARFKTILEEMKETEIVRALSRGGEKLVVNLTGQTMMGSEYWADTLDRWAEELVAASNCKSSTSGSSDSLPPEIVLKVMQALRDEMQLRDETREMENAKPALDVENFEDAAMALANKQRRIGRHTSSAINDILELPQGSMKFSKEIQLLNAAVAVMSEAEGILAKPDTGAAAIAAETEVIELLLQARRMGQNGGGGGGSNPGGGGRAATASSAALADLGPGADSDGMVAARVVGQATGRAGKEFPTEFKRGLDAYFNLLEAQEGEGR